MPVNEQQMAWRNSLGVIDAHTHLEADWLKHAIAIMDRNGLQTLIDIGWRYGYELDNLLNAFKAYPGRFAAFSGLEFSEFGEPGWAQRECERLDRSIHAGAVGLKLHKSLGLSVKDTTDKLVAIDDERLASIFEKAAELGCVVAMHIADPKAFFQPLSPNNERWDELEHNPDWWFGDRSRYHYGWWQLIRQLEKVVARHPRTTILGVHFGCAAEEITYVADVMREYPNYIVDVAARLGELGRHEPALVRELFMEFQDRILFGTDLGVAKTLTLGAPQGFDPTDADTNSFYAAHWRYFETADQQINHPTPIQGRWKIDAIDLPQTVLEKLYKKNASRYLLS